MDIEIRSATVRDVKAIHRLLNEYATQRLLLPRSLNELYEGVRDFFVAAEGERILGCCALEVAWENLAEVKCLAVASECQGRGVGRQLVERALADSAALGITAVFCLTYQVEFFTRLGFVVIDRERLPHKVWGDCLHCPKFPDCDETAMVFWANGEQDLGGNGQLGVPPLTPRVAPAAG
ncbi:MAG: GNAT family N-acetyltransferase [Armatimonadetes bacterium CG_4_10_14_3_um_filter_66_18]|nr:N-acetyltransferase [Armatimonadota bacterium]OIP01090.1 MAG: hypothetical protein AUJ96_17990 [Armatimonadetes bacterium CG2_30_66_41]PIU92781.1 MAG: GNAT family N-acetyltransferase [Armatimonadetes bacterium CG06_land_8_20_14_3_00_66_21]PIX39818.1 MAG: GNAT family N-acetyltransferase [Armatimonadetes bacterium CG_4_8_14_3_um_filter_66_20]PIY53669.1 MAG: GNAT family N-acetyltransferase [Armatimonadetes bacterium CG_4_10_14_3_um_filter_66_18]PIZ40949.1 MAG: GNAT family N-acetyltransferase [